MSSLDYLDLCRLCLVKDRVSVPIFDGEGDVRQIFLKIAACLPVKVAREDKLPKKICDDCVYKVELFYQFWNTTVNAEKQLLQWLGEVGMEGKQGYVTNVLNPNVMKQEQSTENRLDGSVMQQVSEHQNNMGIGMMDNIGLGIPMIISNTNQQQQITSVPMDTSSNSAQNVQAVPGPSSQTTHNQISQNQTSSTQQEEEEESSEDEENSDDECDGDEGLPVKEESEEDPNSRTIEPTTFVNVSLACDEAGPSGLQQQKIADMPEIPMPQTADGDPKSGIPTIAVTPPTLKATQAHSIKSNGPFPDIDEMLIQIKDPPASDNEDENSVQCDFEINYDFLYKERKPKQENAINDLYYGGTNYCSLTNKSNDGCLSDGLNANSLEAKIGQIKEEPSVDIGETNSYRSNTILFVSVGVNNETGFDITNCVRVPDLDANGSSNIDDVPGQLNAELIPPQTKQDNPLVIKNYRPILPKLGTELNGEISSLKMSDPRTSAKRTENVDVQVKHIVQKNMCNYQNVPLTNIHGNEVQPKQVIEFNEEISSRKKSDSHMSVPREENDGIQAKPVVQKDTHKYQKVSVKDIHGSELLTVYENLQTICPYCHNTYSSKKGMQRHFRKYHQNHYRCKDLYFLRQEVQTPVESETASDSYTRHRGAESNTQQGQQGCET
ncbi:uncharacterized protein LOC143345562 isoform X23 [Colletes latitarsis]|uniref:uncharacterized protein LOC143345562 isoform X23 n=1 Tax=Colletes latitarsis TaxID=2605962 RepID=UPI004037582D